MKVDVVVVGGGSAGAICAYYLASKGVSTLLADRRERPRAGATWINGVEQRIFEELELGDVPDGVCGHRLDQYVMIAHGFSDRVLVNAPPTIEVDMRHLNRWLLKLAEDAGAKTRFRTSVHVGDYHGSHVDVRVGGESLKPALVIDASGFAKSKLHEQLLPALDICSAYQAVYEVRDADAAREWLGRHNLQVGDNCSQVGVQGGFSLINVTVAADLETVAVLTGTMQKPGPKSGGQLAGDFVRGEAWIGKKMFGAGRLIPLRGLAGSAVSDGIIRIGDSAGQVFPAHGSGVANGMHAGVFAANTAAAAIQLGDVSEAGLWSYEVAFARDRGSVSAFYQPFRYLSQSLRPDETALLIRSGLINEQSVRRSMDILLPKVSPISLLRTVPYIRELAPLMPRFAQSLSIGEALRRHYKELPKRHSAADCDKWFKRRERLLQRASHLARVEA